MKSISFIVAIITAATLGLFVLVSFDSTTTNSVSRSQNMKVYGDVVAITDGDTIRVRVSSTTNDAKLAVGTTTSVRLIGVDAPEINWKKDTAECFGWKARQFVAKKLDNASIRAVTDASQPEFDSYDRLLAYVYKEGENINKQLLQKGYARELTVGAGYVKQGNFRKLVQAAQNADRGLWRACY